MDSLLASGWQGSMWFPDGFQVTWEGWQGFLQPPQYHVRAMRWRWRVCCCLGGGKGGMYAFLVIRPNHLLTYTRVQNVFADSHLYLLFDPALAQEGPDGLTNYVCQVRT